MKNILYYIAATMFSFNLCAQDTLITEKDTIITNTGKIEVDQVEVIKAFEAKLSDAKRIGVAPKVKAVVPVDKTYNYDITIVPVDIVYPDPVIKPLAMNPDAPKNVDHFFTRLGYGDLKSPYADASYQYVKGDEYDFIIDTHFYGADDSEKIENRKFYQSALNIKGGYRIGENNKLSLDLGGNYDYRNLYDTLFARTLTDGQNIERNVLNIGTEVAFQNIETTDGGFDYRVFINGGRISMPAFFNDDDASEIRFGAGLNTQKRFSDKFSIILDADANFFDLNLTSSDTSLQKMFTIKPGVQFSIGSFTMKALADIFIDNNDTNPFLEAEVNVSILDNSIQIYLGVDQKVTVNSLANKYKSNPFVNTLAEEHKNTIAKQYYGGVRGKMKDFLTFNFSAGYENIKDQRFDTNQWGLLMRSIYDDMTNIFINANLEFKVNDHISVGGIVNQNFFDPETLDNVINMAAYSYNGYSKITLLNKKLVLRADINLADKIYWEDFAYEEQYSGNKQLDLSIGVDYYFTKNIGLWVRGNNLLDREYLKYHYYPGFGRNLLGGITARF
jgi:hypothetical protein